MEKNNINAVKMVREIRDRHYKLLKGKSVDEQIAFYREKANRMRIEAEKRATSKLTTA